MVNPVFKLWLFVLTRSCYVAHVSLQLAISFLSQPHWWENKHTPTFPVNLALLISTTRLTVCELSSIDKTINGRDLLLNFNSREITFYSYIRRREKDRQIGRHRETKIQAHTER